MGEIDLHELEDLLSQVDLYTVVAQALTPLGFAAVYNDCGFPGACSFLNNVDLDRHILMLSYQAKD